MGAVPPPGGLLPLPRPNEPVARECVEGYLFSRDPLAMLVFRRVPARGSIWVPVQGKVETSDASLEAALLREVREETGLEHAIAVVSLDWHVPFRAENGEVWRLHAYGVEVPRSFHPQLNDENQDCEWLEPAEAERRLHFTDNREAVARLRVWLDRHPGR
jgi:8-oxo-dGTP pyrophosphatase MutT (NUDIX family)